MAFDAVDYRLRGFRVNSLVEADDPPKCREWIGRKRVPVGVRQAPADGGAAGAGVLDHDGGGAFELADEPQHGLQVEVVVEGKRLAVKLSRRGKSDWIGQGAPVEGGLLVWVLAVAELADSLVRLKEELRKRLSVACPAGEVAVDGRVVARGVRESIQRKLTAGRIGYRSVLLAHLLQDRLIASRADNDGHRPIVLRRRSHHGGPADVDVLDGVHQAHVRLRDCLLERVEVHRNQIDERNAVLLRGRQVLRIVAEGQQSAVDLRMQGLDPAVHHLGKAGVVGDIGDLDPALSQVRGSASG